MKTYEKYLNESVDVEKSLLTKLQKIGEAAHRITLARYKLEDRLVAVGKIMKKKNIEKIINQDGVTICTQNELLNDASEVLFNMMA